MRFSVVGRRLLAGALTPTLAWFLFLSPLRAESDARVVAEPSVALPALTADQIVSRLETNNRQRAAALHGYRGRRLYELSYRGFPSARAARMEVAVRYEAPASKEFEVVSASGSKVIQTKVFARLLQSEREAMRGGQQRASALSAENYRFTLLGSRPSTYGGCYRLAVEPRHEDRFLYRGEICVNARDFAVESIDAEPAQNPSFWTRRTRIEHRYRKVGEFWLPASNLSVSNVRLGGQATLRILYTDYELQ